MQAEYVKEWTETYLCVFPEKPGMEAYIERMLKQPGIGRLECAKEFKEGREGYRYKVSGKKALSAVYAALPMKEGQIRHLLWQVIEALEDAKEYLLSGDDFLLEPSHMFLELPKLTLALCYVPGYGKELGRQLEGLLEYMLNRVDYEDKPAVELLYDCYTICMKYKGGLEQLKKRLGKEDAPLLDGGAQPERLGKGAAILADSAFPTAQPFSARMADAALKQGQPSYASWIKGKFATWRKKKEEDTENDGKQGEKDKEKQKEKYNEKYKERQKEKHSPDIKMQESIWEAEKRQLYEQEEASRTVLLAVREQKRQPQLIHEQTGEVILLMAFPFYLGSGKEYATHAVPKDGISRLHFCIQKKEGQYYLSDLNSTNGTYVNGVEVLPGMEQKLEENDRIRVASEEFLFSA